MKRGRALVLMIILLSASLVGAGTISNNDPFERILAARGMYLLSDLPKGVEQCPGWKEIKTHLDAARAATVQTGYGPGGGTGVMTGPSQLTTNWHNVFEHLPESSAHLVESGCYAAISDEALPLDIEILVSTEPTTEEIAATTAAVLAAVKSWMSFAEAGKARSDVIEHLEKECEASLGEKWQCHMDRRRAGAEYALYRHRVYKDARLVYLPPISVTYRDSDNFEHGLERGRFDLAELQIFDEGKSVNLQFVPVATVEFKEGDRGFVVGNPGSTNWTRTPEMAREEMTHRGIVLERHARFIQLSSELAARRPELADAVAQSTMSPENEVKIAKATIAEAPAIEAFRRHRDAKMRYTLRVLDRSGQIMAEADAVSKLLQDPANNCRTNWAERYVWGSSHYGPRFKWAWGLHRWARFFVMPEGKRPKGWEDVEQVRKKFDIPLADIDLEGISSAVNLELLAKYLPDVREALGGSNAYEAARQELRVTSLNPQTVAKFLEAGPEAIKASQDPLMRIARLVEGIGWNSRPLRARVEESRARAEQLVSLAQGQSNPLPTADGASRLILSEVRGHREGNHIISPFATIGTLAGRKDIGLPDWFMTAGANDPTVVNVEAEALTTGGVSGSGAFQVVADELAVTGLVFDGNRHQIQSESWQGGPESRTVIVTMAGVRRFREMAGACEGCGPRRLPPCNKK